MELAYILRLERRFWVFESPRGYNMKKFYLNRIEDESGVSGTGRVAEGVQFSNGKCAISWLTNFTSVAVYDSIYDVIAIHGHQGKTQIVWVD
jgi:hypothetical protein